MQKKNRKKIEKEVIQKNNNQKLTVVNWVFNAKKHLTLIRKKNF